MRSGLSRKRKGEKSKIKEVYTICSLSSHMGHITMGRNNKRERCIEKKFYISQFLYGINIYRYV